MPPHFSLLLSLSSNSLPFILLNLHLSLPLLTPLPPFLLPLSLSSIITKNYSIASERNHETSATVGGIAVFFCTVSYNNLNRLLFNISAPKLHHKAVCWSLSLNKDQESPLCSCGCYANDDFNPVKYYVALKTMAMPWGWWFSWGYGCLRGMIFFSRYLSFNFGLKQCINSTVKRKKGKSQIWGHVETQGCEQLQRALPGDSMWSNEKTSRAPGLLSSAMRAHIPRQMSATEDRNGWLEKHMVKEAGTRAVAWGVTYKLNAILKMPPEYSLLNSWWVFQYWTSYSQ